MANFEEEGHYQMDVLQTHPCSSLGYGGNENIPSTSLPWVHFNAKPEFVSLPICCIFSLCYVHFHWDHTAFLSCPTISHELQLYYVNLATKWQQAGLC